MYYRLALQKFPSLDNFQGPQLEEMTMKLGQLRYNYGTTLMLNGDYQEGLQYYDDRLYAFDQPRNFAARFKHPKWDGEDIKDRVLLLFSEQGVGDLFMFVRHIHDLLEMGPKKIILEAQKDAAEIISKNFPMIKVIPREHVDYEEPPPADYALSICSLPNVLGYNDMAKISGKPYLTAPKRKPPRALKESKNFKVGLAWAGNPNHGHDHMRSCQFKYIQRLLDVPGVDFFNFQKDVYPSRVWNGKVINIHEGFENSPVKDITPFFKTFTDTAVCLDNIDLLITIDSATAHLAGALGCRTWMIIPFIPDWRWVKTLPNSTIWYDTMQIYRQPKL